MTIIKWLIFFVDEKMKRTVCWVLLLLALLACKRKDEVSYSELEGTWYLYAAYKVDQNTDWLPLAAALGYDCLNDMTMEVTTDSFFVAAQGKCVDMAMRGDYSVLGDSILGHDKNGNPVYFFYRDGVLSTITNVKVLGDMDLRFQKKTVTE